MRTTNEHRSMPRAIRTVCVLAVAVAIVAPAHAETQISVFGGMNENLSSRVKLDKGAVSEDRSMDWEGKSFDLPPYWGVRGTYWFNSGGPGWGVALDYVHAKSYADLDFETDPTYSRLEFTDGLNLLTLNAMYRFAPVLYDALVPYAGVGVGLSIPHVEVSLKAFPGQNTFEYQLAGVAAQALVGLEYRMGPTWSVFAEGRLSYAHVEADLSGGGTLETDIWSPQLAVGLTYRFGGP